MKINIFILDFTRNNPSIYILQSFIQALSENIVTVLEEHKDRMLFKGHNKCHLSMTRGQSAINNYKLYLSNLI